MRNFKKFLALVLAMLMVSACAIGASAAFTDQDDVDASGYANAVSILNDLGVIQGKKSADGSVAFDPNGTLTREEAAVIAAKLIAGNKNVAWDNVTTCRFADVTAKWSFGYIEYAADRGVLDGTGNGFNPKGTLSVAEATAIAVKLLGLKGQVAELDKANKPSVWYVNYIDVASNYGLLDKVDPFSYTQNCTRGEMAQIALNVLNASKNADGTTFKNKISEGFGMKNASLEIASVKDGVVTMKTGEKFGEAALNAALANKGVDKKVADLKGAKVIITYNDKQIYGATLASDAYSFNYATGELSIVKDSGNNNTNKIKLGETTYIVADEDEKVLGGVIGGQTTGAKAVKLTVDGNEWFKDDKKNTLKDIPNFYAAIAYDDDNDGSFDRIVMNEYHAGTIVTGNAGAAEGNEGGTVYKYYTVKNLKGEEVFTNKGKAKHVEFTGKEFSFGEVPVLYYYAVNADSGKYEIDILEVAETVEGKLTELSAGKYVNVGGTKYDFAKENNPGNAVLTLGQNIAIYTIGGKFVAFTSSSIVSKSLIVDSASINAAGKAVINGININNGTRETVILEGAKVGSVFRSKNAEYTTNDAKTRLVKLNGVEFVEGGYYAFNTTKDGVYLIGEASFGNKATTLDKLVEAGESNNSNKFAISGGYIIENGVRTRYTTDNPVILVKKVETDSSKVTTAYNKISYSIVSTISERTATANNKSTFVLVDADKNITNGKDAAHKPAFIYFSELTSVTEYSNNLNGNKLVQILNTTEIISTLDTTTYKAVNLLDGKAVSVTAKNADVTIEAGKFYLVDSDNNVVGKSATNWVDDGSVNPIKVEKNAINEFIATSTRLANGDLQINPNATKDARFSLGITIYKTDAKGIILLNNEKTEAQKYNNDEIQKIAATSKLAVKSFVNGSTMILVENNGIDGRLFDEINTPVVSGTDKLDEKNTIVQVIAKDTVVDIFTGEVKTLTAAEAKVGKFFEIAKDATAVADDATETAWIGNVAGEGNNVQITVTVDGDKKTYAFASWNTKLNDKGELVKADDKASAFTNVKAIKIGDNGVIVTKSVATLDNPEAKVAELVTDFENGMIACDAFINNGQMIIFVK